ncbi:MAG: CHAT domain-containing protein [Acidobacteriota bacterium]|nr:CHAT domain-containing protein [Acidobacteriota bacterium]
MTHTKARGILRLPCLLALGVLLLFSWLPAAQEAPAQRQTVSFDALLKEMISILDAGGEVGLKAWIKADKNRIADDFVLFALQAAASRGTDKLRRGADILASEKGNAYLTQAGVSLDAGESVEAKARLDKALPFFEKARDFVGLGKVYRREGNLCQQTGENAKALIQYEKALTAFKKADYLPGQGTVYMDEGDINLYSGDHAKALDLYEKARVCYEKAKSPIGMGNVYRRKGDIFYDKGENAEALAMYEKALPCFEEAKDLFGQGNVLKSQGDVYLYTGENAKALAVYEKALAVFEKTGHPLGPGNVYAMKGELYKNTGDFAKALAMYEKARPYYEKLQEPFGLGLVHISEGEIFQSMGEYAKALALYEKALPFFEKTDNALGLGNVHFRRAEIHAAQDRFAEALASYEKAKPFYEKAEDPVSQGFVYQGEGSVHARKGEYAQAFALFEKARPFFEKADHPLGQAGLYTSEGDAYLETGESSQAYACYEKADGLCGRIGDIEGSARARLGQAKALGRLGRPTEALPLYEAGLANWELIRAQAIVPEMKKSFLQVVYKDYDDAALFMLGNGSPERGFRIVESMKARLFLDQLAENLAGVDKGLDPALKERRDALTARLSSLAQAIEAAAGEKNEAKLSERIEEKRKAEAEFENLQMEIRLKNPAYAALRYPEPVSLDVLTKKVLRRGEVLVEYYLSGEKAFAFVVTKEGLKAVALPAGSEAIQSAAQAYLGWINNPRRPEAERNRLAAGAALYGQLLRPLESNLPKGATIIIVPDGELARLPFESLVISLNPAANHPVYLLEKYPVKYIQSASILAFLRTQFKQEGVTNAFIGFGDPVYDYEHFRKKEPERGSALTSEEAAFAALNRDRFVRGGGTLDRLEGSGREVTEIAKLFQAESATLPDKPEMKLRLDASEENAKAPSIGNYGYVHYSCHGLLGDGYQCLVLSQVPGAGEDGFLTLGEIMNSGYKARLVVLSACQTGQGAAERGEGVTGLTRAVMFAGSPAAVVSLWSVSDEATRQLMVRFYRHMIKDGLAKDEALRRAKLEILRGAAKTRISENSSVSISHPFFWAAFVMYGE